MASEQRLDRHPRGRSDIPNDNSLWTIGRFCDEIDALRAALGLTNVILLGHSWGGWLAIEYMTRAAVAPKVEDLAERVEVLPDRLLLYSADGEETIAKVHERGLDPVVSLVRRSTLEDVFLRLTGRTLVD